MLNGKFPIPSEDGKIGRHESRLLLHTNPSNVFGSVGRLVSKLLLQIKLYNAGSEGRLLSWLFWQDKFCSEKGKVGKLVNWFALQSSVTNPDGSVGRLVNELFEQFKDNKVSGNGGNEPRGFAKHSKTIRFGSGGRFVTWLFQQYKYFNVTGKVGKEERFPNAQYKYTKPLGKGGSDESGPTPQVKYFKESGRLGIVVRGLPWHSKESNSLKYWTPSKLAIKLLGQNNLVAVRMPLHVVSIWLPFMQEGK